MASAPLVSLLAALQQTLDTPTLTASLLPPPSDLSFERTLSRALAKQLDATSLQILTLADDILRWSTSQSGDWKGLDGEMIREGEYRDVVSAVEPLLEGADDSLERQAGTGKFKVQPIVASKASNPATGGNGKAKPLPKSLTLADIPKPQLLFPPSLNLPRPPISLLTSPEIPSEPYWKPISIDSLPAVVQLPLPVAQNLQNVVLTLPPSSPYVPLLTTTYPAYEHPFKRQLDDYTPPPSYFSKPTLGEPKGQGKWDEVPFEWIDSEEGLNKLVEEIESAGNGEHGRTELAIDLEHHETRSWGGVTSLMQLSTRTKDYVIDVLAPSVRSGIHILNRFFANAEWIKVFHGAYSDIIWLQRDLGLYIVGLFDTYCATNVLEYQQHSLASLLLMFTDFVPDKRYQLADWRIRPIPEEMLLYARADTHFLLDIYDHLRLALHDQPSPSSSSSSSSLQEVIDLSLTVSSAVFSIPPYSILSVGAPLSLMGKFGVLSDHFSPSSDNPWGPNGIKFNRLLSLTSYRESLARSTDESPNYILKDPAIEVMVNWHGEVEDDAEVLKILRNNVRGGISAGLRGMSEEVRGRRERLVKAMKEARERVEKARHERESAMEVDQSVESGKRSATVERGSQSVEPVVQALAGLWDASFAASPASAVPVASSSSFFGFGKKKVEKATSTVGVKALGSSFFGSASKGKGKRVEKEESEVDAFEEGRRKVEEIHQTLVLGEGLSQSLRPHTIPSFNATPTLPVAAESSSLATEDAVEHISNDHSFVAFEDRAPKAENTISSKKDKAKESKKERREETIVVSSLPGSGSGGSSGKKRRRGKTTTDATSLPQGGAADSDAAPAPKPKKVKPSPDSIVPHDYSSQPSILDASQTSFAHAGTSKKEKKAQKAAGGGQKKGFEIDTSAFRREPRVNNASKKGLVSMSFAKGAGSKGK